MQFAHHFVEIAFYLPVPNSPWCWLLMWIYYWFFFRSEIQLLLKRILIFSSFYSLIRDYPYERVCVSISLYVYIQHQMWAILISFLFRYSWQIRRKKPVSSHWNFKFCFFYFLHIVKWNSNVKRKKSSELFLPVVVFANNKTIPFKQNWMFRIIAAFVAAF